MNIVYSLLELLFFVYVKAVCLRLFVSHASLKKLRTVHPPSPPGNFFLKINN